MAARGLWETRRTLMVTEALQQLDRGRKRSKCQQVLSGARLTHVGTKLSSCRVIMGDGR